MLANFYIHFFVYLSICLSSIFTVSLKYTKFYNVEIQKLRRAFNSILILFIYKDRNVRIFSQIYRWNKLC